ncbi:hypothetical protein HK098_006822 [Nowakowskiella sp. JEL0407]|nr:hypothetical protein HK098_006822 [Nowakowskiella sp. JEL0407]
MVEYDIYQAQQLEDQFAEILNYQLDDFEFSLSQLKKKREILSGTALSEDKDRDTSFKVELTEIVTGFRKRIEDLISEKNLLKTHIKGLKIALSSYVNDHATSIQRSADGALRKYAISMQVSEDNGDSFSMLKGIPYCNKCGEKTILCPHKTHQEIIAIPLTTTHLKFQHPKFKLKTEFNKSIFEANLEPGLVDEGSEYVETEDENLQATQTFLRIWKDYYDNRNGTKPKLNRKFTLDRIHSFIQEIYQARWVLEEESEGEDIFSTFADFFYEFMEKRYQVKEVALKVTHDIFTALQFYEAESLNVQIFTRHVSGEDDAVWKYLMLARKLIAKYETIDLASYRSIIQVIYPSRAKELYEQMELELIAFCKNKFSRDMMEEHLMHMLAKLIEPNYKFFYRSLKRFDYQDVGGLAFDEFDEALGQILPVAPNKLKQVRFKLAQLDVKRDETAAYISMYCCYTNNWIPQAVIAAEFLDVYGGYMDETVEGEDTQKEVETVLQSRGSAPAVTHESIADEVDKLQKRVAALEPRHPVLRRVRNPLLQTQAEFDD